MIAAYNEERNGLLIPRRFVRKYRRLIKRAGFQVAKVIADPFPGVKTVPYQIKGHQLLLIEGIENEDQHVRLILLLAKWERLLENEN